MHALPALASQRILRRSLFGDIDKNTFYGKRNKR
jgi:hypothetical protein